MYSQINGASRALEDVRARQQDMRVSDRAVHHQPGPWASPSASRQHRLSSDLHKAHVRFIHSFGNKCQPCKTCKKLYAPREILYRPKPKTTYNPDLGESLKIRVEK